MEKTPLFQIKEYVYREYKLNPDFPVIAFLEGQYAFEPEPDTITWLHFHNCVEIIYCREERIVDIENEIYFAKKGSVCVISPNQLHNTGSLYRNKKTGAHGSEYVYFDPGMLLGDFFTETYSFHNVFEQINEKLKNVISAEENPQICRLTVLILEELRREKTDRDVVKGLFLAFWIELVRTLDMTSIHYMAKRRDLTEVYPAMLYAREHLSQRISTEAMAEECHMSPSQFRRNFKQCLGITPQSYIMNLRLSGSCDLLQETELGILDIALRCGFNSLSSYNSQFTKRYGVSPSQWKKTQRNIKKTSYSHKVYHSS